MIKTIGRFMFAVFKLVFTLLLIGVLTTAMFSYQVYHYISTEVWPSEEVNINLSTMPVNLSSTIYYKDKETGQYQEWVTLKSTENRTWIDYEDLPEDFEHAFVAIEDERFYTHRGVDWKRTCAAAVNRFTGKTVFGGSTITQQLIKNLTQDKEVTIHRKLVEICRALKMEQNYSKQEIIEWYTNIIYFGRGQYGIGAAAKYYFDKEISELSLSEMCSIAGITNNPSKYDPYAYPRNNRDRRDLILDKMLEIGYISEAECQKAKAEPLKFRDRSIKVVSYTENYPYYVDAVIEDVLDYFQKAAGVDRERATTMLYYGGYNIYACVDMDIQKKMDSVYQDMSQIPETRDGKPLQSSMTIIDPTTGDIVGIEGGVGEKTVARGLNWASSDLGRRPPGSSIKPLSAYSLAMDKELISPDTVILDAANIKLKGTSWFPKNDNWKNYGYVTVRTGVIQSLNTIAAQVLDKVTPSVAYEQLTQKLHMELRDEDCDYAPLAAGQLSIGTTTREMASAYTIFPNCGTYRQGRTFSRITDNKGALVVYNNPVTETAISGAAAYWMTDMLEDAVSYGTGRAAKLSNIRTAGKTGTTSDSKDRWFVGYTPYYVGAVWTGYETPAAIHVSGNPAAKLWKAVMELIHEDLDEKDFPKPVDVTLHVKVTRPPRPKQEEQAENPDQQEEGVPDETQTDPPAEDEPLDWMKDTLGTEPGVPPESVTPAPVEDPESIPPESGGVAETTPPDGEPPEWIILPEEP